MTNPNSYCPEAEASHAAGEAIDYATWCTFLNTEMVFMPTSVLEAAKKDIDIELAARTTENRL